MRRLVVLSVVTLLSMQSIAFAQTSCRAEVGQRQADIYVAQCRDVSPATHPPCNVQNPCALIIAEIKRGCALLSKAEKPAYCAKYASP
jgi:hypothetical protein